MSKISDFKIGEAVVHIVCGDGNVTAIENGIVIVTYARKTPGKENWVGRYDERWFELNPNLLFHRFTTGGSKG